MSRMKVRHWLYKFRSTLRWKSESAFGIIVDTLLRDNKEINC